MVSESIENIIQLCFQPKQLNLFFIIQLDNALLKLLLPLFNTSHFKCFTWHFYKFCIPSIFHTYLYVLLHVVLNILFYHYLLLSYLNADCYLLSSHTLIVPDLTTIDNLSK